MIYPTSADLLAGVAAALEETVLPELTRGTAARRQLQAAVAILRRVAFALPGEAAVVAADVEDMEAVARRAAAIWESLPDAPPPPPNLPHQGGGTRILKALPLDGGGLGGGDLTALHESLQAVLVDLQGRLAVPQDLRSQITPLLIDLHKRMTDRALSLIPPPVERGPGP